MTDRAFVLALSGIPGAGKTTLTRLLLKTFSHARAVHHDHFQTITRMSHDDIRSWFARGADPNEFTLTELADELTRQAQIRPDDQRRPLVIFETPFGRLHRTTGPFIDFLVWLDLPLDVALARATLSFLGRVQPAEAAKFVKWQTQYMLNYPVIRPMYLDQREKILPFTDLVLDGNKTLDELVALVKEALKPHGIEP